MVKIKICGITRYEDAKLAEELGANALGFIFFKESKRFISPERTLEIIKKLSPLTLKVGVFVNESIEKIYSIKEFCKLDRIQLYSDNKEIYKNLDPITFIPVFKIRNEKDLQEIENYDLLPLLDTYHDQLHGGTGKTFDWELLRSLKKPYILAGGINPDNVLSALKYKPFAIDVASGLELSPGIKDHKKMFEFFKKIRENHKIYED